VRTVAAANPARGLNLFSAVCGAIAAGLLVWVVAAVSGSLASGIAAGFALAFSYTFWSQSVIAEVYTLHLALIGAALTALYAFALKPSRTGLAIFCAVYALAFGNHLAAILLFVPFASFVLMADPRRRELFRPAQVAMVLAIAAAGALLYAPEMLATWSSIDAPAAASDRIAAFWFDVTKADWRSTMILGIDPAGVGDRLAMWRWDGWQQFGVAGLLLAAAGAVRLWWISRAWAVMLWLAYAINTVFAVTYNVGDAHVFFLPGHYFTAFAIGLAAAPWTVRPDVPRVRSHRLMTSALAVIVIGYSVWRGWETWPAADRHRDVRADQLMAQTMGGLSAQTDLLVARMNWDQETALTYAARHERPDVAFVRLLPVLGHFRHLVADNHAIGRDIVLTGEAAATVVAAYDGGFPLVEDPRAAVQPLSAVVERLPRGTPYLLAVLTPLPAYPFDSEDADRAAARLTGGRDARAGGAPYRVVAGLAGEAPTFTRDSPQPFRARLSLDGTPVTVRIDGWLPSETFRRGGFGHVLRGREPVLVIERGVSLLWFDRDDAPRVAYAGGPYAPQPRFRIPVQTTHLASR
jgi:hypothetical protein